MEEDDVIELLGALGAFDDDDGDPILGARRIPRRRALTRRSARTMLRQKLVPKTPGVPTPGGRQQPLGFSEAHFLINAPAGTVLEMEANPDRPFGGKRLIITVARSDAGAGGLISVRRLDVGGKNQLASRQPVGVEAFQPDATLTFLDLDPLTPGVPAVMEVQNGVLLGAAETVDVGATLYGASIS